MRALIPLLNSPFFVLGLLMFSTALVSSLLYPLISEINPMERLGMPFDSPGENFWLGTNNEGQDVFSQLFYGMRSSIYVGLAAGCLATLVGTLVGLASGYLGGKLDDLFTVITNLFIVIPSLIILILISNSVEERSLTLVACIIGATTWTWTARAVRAQAASLKKREHVLLAKLNGNGLLYILFFCLLPYMLSYVFMAFILQMATGILSESAISMLGLGPYDTVTLGNILNSAQQHEALSNGNWWVFLPSALAVTLLTFSLYLINTSMEGVFNPRLRN